MIIMTVVICAMVFGIRYMRSREIMAMIEKGLDPNLKPEKPRPAPPVRYSPRGNGSPRTTQKCSREQKPLLSRRGETACF